MLSVTHFKIAIQNALENSDVAALVKHGEVDLLTGDTRISIAESHPNTYGIVPFVSYEVLDTEPLAKDDPTLRNYVSIVLIFATAETSAKATRLADTIAALFTNRPCEADRRWYYDISDNCIVNTFTKFVSRLRFGRDGQNVVDYETNTVREAVEVKFWWADQGCDGCTTLPPMEEPQSEVGDIVCDC